MIESAMRTWPGGLRRNGDGGPEGEAIEADLPAVLSAYAGPVSEGVEAFLSGLTDEGRAAAMAMRDCDAFNWTAFSRASEPDEAGGRCRAFMEACPGFGASVLMDDAGWRAVANGAAPHEALAALDKRRQGMAYLKGRLTDYKISVEGARRLAASPGRPATMGAAARRSMMAAAMPPHWAPRTPDQDEAFDSVVSMHHEATLGHDYAPVSADHVDAFLRGCKGDWVAYRERCVSAAAPEHRSELPALLSGNTREKGHFATDVLLPIALAYDDGPILEVAAATRSVYRRPLLMRLGDALLGRGLDLPGAVHQSSRHRSARSAIKRAIQAFPRPDGVTVHRFDYADHNPFALAQLRENAPWDALPRCVARDRFEMHAFFDGEELVRLPADTPDGFVWLGLRIRCHRGTPEPSLVDALAVVADKAGCPLAKLGTFLAKTAGLLEPLPPTALDVRENRCWAPYDWSQPQAREAVLRAWSPAMPRRMRRLDGRGLLDVIAPEVEAFMLEHREELDAAREDLAAMRRHLHPDPFAAMPAQTGPDTDSDGAIPCP